MTSGPNTTGKHALWISLVLALSLALNLWCITWGQPGGVEWDFDSIAGLQSVKEIRYFPSEWRHKYPPVQFVLAGKLYEPWLLHWFGDLDAVPLAEGKILADMELGRRFGVLIIISHVVSALMGTGSVLAVWLAGRAFFKDPLVALFAAATLCCSQMFMFYSHLGNIDVPAAFWFAWSLYAAARVVQRQSALNFAFLGLAAALSVCTKDAALGYLAGLALALFITLVPQANRNLPVTFRNVLSPFTLRVLAGLAVFVVCFGFFNGVFHDPALLTTRLAHWVDGPGTSDYNKGFISQGGLLLKAGRDLYLSIGWPLAVAGILSGIHAISRARRAAAFGLLPLIAFYLVIVVQARLVAPRFFLPGLVALALLIGHGCAAWSRWMRVPSALRASGIGAVFGLSLLYCVGLDLEMSSDTRYRAEEWFVANVPRETRVGHLSPAAIAPRLRLFGYKEDYRYGYPTEAEVLRREPAFPDYIVLSEKWYTAPELFDLPFLQRLLNGDEGYEIVAKIENLYLYPQRTVWGLAGWPLHKLNQISPILYILKRKEGASPGVGS